MSDLVLSTRLIADSKSLRNELRITKQEFDKVSVGTKKVGTAARQTATDLDRMGREARETARRALRLNAGMGGLSGTFSALRGQILGLGAAFVSFRGAFTAARIIADFQSSMSGVAAVTSATAAEMEVLTRTARDLGATTSFSASQAAAGMEFLGRAGFNATEIVAAMPHVLNLAAAAELDLGRAADIASNIMSAFGIAAADSAGIADVLAAAAASANTDVSQLGEAMKYVGPVARAMGVSLEDATAAVGTLSNAGIQATMAGTGLRRILSELASPGKAARTALAGLGLTMEDVNPTTRSLVEIVDTLAVAGMDATDAFEIFGDRGAPAILALTANRGELERLTDALSDTTGEAERMARIKLDNLTGDVLALKSAFDELVLQSGDAGLSGAMRGLIQDATGVLRVFGDIEQKGGENVERFEDLARGIETVAGAAGAFLGARLAAGLVGIGAAAARAAFGMLTLNAAMIANPVGLIATGIATATAALIYFRDTEIEVGGQTATVTDFLVASWGLVAKGVAETWELMEGFASAPVWRTVIAPVEAVWKAYKGAFNFIVAGFTSIGDAAAIMAARVAEEFGQAINFVMELFGDLGRVWDLMLSGNFADIGTVVGEALARSFEGGFVAASDQMAAALEANFNKDWLGGWMASVWEGAGDIAEAAVEGVAARAAQRYKARMAAINEKANIDVALGNLLPASPTVPVTPVPAVPGLTGGAGGDALAAIGGGSTVWEDLEKRQAEARLRAVTKGMSERSKLIVLRDREISAVRTLYREEKFGAEKAAKAAGMLREIYGDKIAEAEELEERQTSVWSGVKGAMVDYYEGVQQYGRRAAEFTRNSVIRPLEDAFTNFFMTGEMSFKGFFDSVKAGLARLAAQDVVASIGGIFGIGGGSGKSLFGSIVGGIGSFVGSLFAGGGEVSGPGTGTSDSILARLSDGEFVVNAASTRRWLPALKAINAAPGYAAGGVVANDNIPRFSTGGYTGPGHEDEFGASGIGFGGDWASQLADLNERDHRAVEALGDGYNVNAASLAFEKDDPGFFESLGAGFKDFLGVGAPGGWAASPAVSTALFILTNLLTGGMGLLPGAAIGFGVSMAHETLTGGHARGMVRGSGVADAVYGLITGQKSFDKMVGRVVDRFDDMAWLGGGTGTGTGFGGGPDGGGDPVAEALTLDPRARIAATSRDLEGPYADLRGRLAAAWMPVTAAADQGLAMLGDGGIVTRPTLAMIGERGTPEGVAPLRDGRMPVEIPVTTFDGLIDAIAKAAEAAGDDAVDMGGDLKAIRRAIEDLRDNATSGGPALRDAA
jgi:TP901 family phage tail tape measure protein